ncbi:transglutaminase domain-containing protein [Lewinella sp. W8]|uniref:transglutaminase domain-containing protein n=1 Tax=Lewinella sp. W8 TaxID=2528208 RepID=UPI0010673A62|nr:transglutaminase domain-containing protein [Lewinella sp. W8]MTB49816.1 hypothetical protein [Lewinella sp. W8]
MSGSASTLIPPPAKGPQLRKEEYRTGDIMKVVQDIVRGYAHETEQFSRQFSRSEAGLKKLFNWVYRNFTYKEDPPGSQWVQTPAYLNRHRVGDCKSYTAFISSVLQNLGIDHYIRYAAYGTSEYRHVYPVALLDGKQIPLDVVYKVQHGGRFGEEKRYTKKKDIKVKGLYQLGSIDMGASEEEIIGQLKMTLAEVEKMDAQLPAINPSRDVTKMTAGQVDNLIWADRFEILEGLTKDSTQKSEYRAAAAAMRQGDIAGIGSIRNSAIRKQVEAILKNSVKKQRPAFANFSIKIPTPAGVKGLFSGIGNFFRRVGQAIGNLFKKFVNWIFSGVGKKMGPFFIFQFLQRGKIKSPEIRSRIDAQQKSYTFIRRLGKFDDQQLKGLMLNGILERTGKSPKQIAEEEGVPQIGNLVSVVIGAIQFVVKVVEKVAGIFRRSSGDAGRIDETTMSDPSLFEEERRLQQQGGGAGNFNPLLLAAAGIPFILKAL